MIKALTSWRGIFALCIVYFHLGMQEFTQMAVIAVTFFFMVSGFLVAMHNTGYGTHIKRYYKRRLWRIFPLHWLALALLIILDLSRVHQFTYGWDLPLHIALLQSWIPNIEVYYGYSLHSWFLSSLLFCILITPPLLQWVKRVSLPVLWSVLAVAATMLIIVDLYSNNDFLNYSHVCPAIRAIDYTMGIAIFVTIERLRWREKMQHISMANASLLELATLAVLAISVAVHDLGGWSVTEKLESAPLWWIPCALIITCATVLSGHEGILGKLLTLKPLLWLGGISFEIYILQKFVNNAFNHLVAPLFGHYGILIYGFSIAIIPPLLIVTAWLVHKLFNHLHLSR